MSEEQKSPPAVGDGYVPQVMYDPDVEDSQLPLGLSPQALEWQQARLQKGPAQGGAVAETVEVSEVVALSDDEPEPPLPQPEPSLPQPRNLSPDLDLVARGAHALPGLTAAGVTCKACSVCKC